MSVGNWSVSQPSSGSPVLASMEPSAPAATGHFQFVLHGVAGQRGVVGLEVQLEDRRSRSYSRRKFRHAAASESYWCLVGSLGLGSM